MPPVLIAVAAAAASYGAAAAVTGAVIAGFTISATAALAIGSLAGGLTSIALGALIGGKAAAQRLDPVSNSRGIQQLIRGSAETLKIIYGRQRLSGVVAFIGTSDKGAEQNKYLHLVIALAGHEVQEIENIWINDTEVEIQNGEGVGEPWSELGTRIWFGDNGDGLYAFSDAAIGIPGVGRLNLRLDFSNLFINGAGQTGNNLSVRARILVGNPFGDLTSLYPQTVNFTIPAESVLLIGSTQYRTAQPIIIPIVFSTPGQNLERTIFFNAQLLDPITTAPADSLEISLYRKGNNLVLCRKYLGLDDQQAEPELIAAFPSRWTSAHRLRGTAYLYVRLEYNGNAFPNGIPNIQAVVKGKKVYDPRTGSTAYSDNSALCMRDYLVSELGFNAPNKINEQSFIAAANVCDESVALAAGGTEKRYTTNTIIDTSSSLNDAANQLLSPYSGLLSYSQGYFITSGGAYEIPSITVDESWMSGSINLQTKVSRRDLFNGVKGVFIDPANSWQKVSYPVQASTTLATEDGAEILRDIDYPSTTSSATCQRLARIALLKSRQSIRASMMCNFKALQLRPLMIIKVTNYVLGWSEKPFRITNWRFAGDGRGIEIDIEEESATSYDWNTSLELATDPAPNTLLPSAFTVDPPGLPLITEQLEVNTGGILSNTVNLNWTASPSAFVNRYKVEYKPFAQQQWIETSNTSQTTAQIRGLALGVYEFQITAFNEIGQQSKPAKVVYTVTGDTAPPADIENFFITEIGAQAHLSWKQPTDLDVIYGGKIRLRYSSAVPGAWSEAFDVSAALPGTATTAVVPLLSGTYLVKAVDNTGRESINATSITTNVANLLNLNVIETAQESPTFSGSKTGVTVVSGELILDGTSLFDDAAGFFNDGVGLFDGGGTSTFVTSGTYNFANSIDLGAVYTSRVTIDMALRTENTNAIFDVFQGFFDDAPGLFDGEDITGIEATVYVRTTNDNPAASPTWSSWRKFIVGDYTCRAYEFKLEILSNNSSLNIAISQLAVNVDVPDRVEQNEDFTVSASGSNITFSSPFFAVPAIAVSLQNAATGDYALISSKTLTGFTINVYNAAGIGISRTIDWIARAY